MKREDYRSKGVDFYYVYKSLAHPGLDGYVAPATLEERLAHLAEAKEQLGTRIPWIADSMDNGLKRAFGDRPNSEFIVSSEGVVVVARAWSGRGAIRRRCAVIWDDWSDLPNYYACDDEGRWCRSAMQEFALRLKRDRDGGSVRGRRAGSRRPARPERGAGRPGMRDAAAMIQRHDRDGDGAISREEAPAPMADRFEEIDRDGDGRISLEELRDYLR